MLLLLCNSSSYNCLYLISCYYNQYKELIQLCLSNQLCYNRGDSILYWLRGDKVTLLVKDGIIIKKGNFNTELNKHIQLSINFFCYNATSKVILLLILVYLSIIYTLHLLAISLLLLVLLVLSNKLLVLDTSFLGFLDFNYLASILFTFQQKN